MKMNAAQFRANCFKLIDQIQNTKDEIIITKRGKPMAKLVPIANEEKDPLIGILKGFGHTVGDLTEPVLDPESWEVNQ